MELCRGGTFVRMFTTPNFLYTLLLLVLMMTLPVITIYFINRYRLGRMQSLIAYGCVGLECTLFCEFMQSELMPDRITNFFKGMSYLCEVLIVVFVFMIFFYDRESKKRNQIAEKRSPKLDVVFQKMEDAAFIFDWEGRLVSANYQGEAFIERILEFKKSLSKDDTTQTPDTVFALCALTMGANDLEFDALIKDKLFELQKEIVVANRAYWMMSSPFYSKKKSESNRIGMHIVFHEIQEEKSLRTSIELQNIELNQKNELLAKQIQVANTLEEKKERLRLVREIQDSIIAKIELLTKEIASFRSAKETITCEEAKPFLLEITERMRTIFKEVRQNIVQLAEKK